MKHRVWWATIVVAALIGCGQPNERQGGDPGTVEPAHASASTESMGPPEPISDMQLEGYPSAEELVNVILNALRVENESVLHAVRASETMYREVLWPQFERKMPKNNLPVDFHWRLLNIKSTAGARDALHDYGGHDLELRSIEPQSVEDYGPFKLWRRCKLVVYVKKDEKLARIRVFGSIVEKDGRFWVLGYPS